MVLQVLPHNVLLSIPPIPFFPTVPTFAVRETASLGIMGVPQVPPLNPSETIVFCGPGNAATLMEAMTTLRGYCDQMVERWQGVCADAFKVGPQPFFTIEKIIIVFFFH